MHAVPRIFNCFLIRNYSAMKWRMRKQGAIPRNGIPIGNPIYIYMAGQTTGPYWLKLFEETHGYLGGTSGVTWDKKLELFLPQTSRATPGTSASTRQSSRTKHAQIYLCQVIYSFLRKVYVGFKMINIYYFLKSLSFRRKCLIFFCRISWLMMMFGDSTFHIVLVLSGLLTYSTYVN